MPQIWSLKSYDVQDEDNSFLVTPMQNGFMKSLDDRMWDELILVRARAEA